VNLTLGLNENTLLFATFSENSPGRKPGLPESNISIQCTVAEIETRSVLPSRSRIGMYKVADFSAASTLIGPSTFHFESVLVETKKRFVSKSSDY
jgi:hypothetical protein